MKTSVNWIKKLLIWEFKFYKISKSFIDTQDNSPNIKNVKNYKVIKNYLPILKDIKL